MNVDSSLYNKNIILIDADLLDGGTRFPNLAIMKMSGYFKEQNNVRLIESYDELKDVDSNVHIYMSKVFDFTKVPQAVLELPNIVVGGTGFYFDKAEPLPYEIEHHMPDYHIYDDYIAHDTKHKQKTYWKDYQDFSIGFATRGCFRQCPFCVNQKYKRVEFHSHVKEWLDPTRKGIYLWDDNIFGYDKWYEVFDELEETGKPFRFRQGMDIRILNEKKAEILNSSNYLGSFVFAFDNLSESDIIIRKLELWRSICHSETILYVLCGFEGGGAEEIDGIFQRLDILTRYKCKPYIMRHENYLKSPYKDLFVQIARWCNQPHLFMKKTFREYTELCQSYIKTDGFTSAPLRALQKFEADYPEVAAKWFDRKFGFLLHD